MIDYHVHTILCNHAEGSMEKYVQSATAKGLKEICFLDHLTLAESGKYLSMEPGEVGLYYQAVRTLKQRYRNVIEIKVGLEIDFNPSYIDIITEIVETYSFDLIGSSIHFLNDRNIVSSSSSWKNGKYNTDYFYSIYFEQMTRMLEYNYFDMVCHFDMIKKFNRKTFKSFDTEIDTVLDIIKKNNLVVEINTSGINHPAGDIYPEKNIIRKCKKAKINVTLGSDAHNPESVGQHFDKATHMLLTAGYTHLTTFTKRKRNYIAI